jgi:hypothetical protein
MRRLAAAGAVIVLAALAGCAAPEPPPADTGGPKTGVVVLHGERDDPYGQTLRFTRAMQREGFLTDSPEMPWSARRAYDAGVAGAVKEIDASVVRLKSRGAQKVFVAGHGLGASAAVRYARERRVDGLIALAPEGPRLAQTAAAKRYAEFSDPAGPMSLQKNAAAMRPGTPVLWVVGDTEEPPLRKADRAAFEALPRNPPPGFVEVAAGRLDTPDAAGKACADWIRQVVTVKQ